MIENFFTCLYSTNLLFTCSPVNNLGNNFRDLIKLSEAAISLKKAIKLKPNFFEAHRDLGICLYLLKDIDSALKSIVKANYFDKKNRTKTTRGKKVKVSGYKKAIITLKKGQSIDLTTGI